MHFQKIQTIQKIVMSMSILLEYNDNYFMTSESQWNFCRDEVIEDAVEINEFGYYRINNNMTK